ncbi:ABC transporter G family member 23 isoform X2 [Belonocnema kinseyi]|uniref:ABC transporter G family member 23 isoform X2 n=1 Tax=Belonocnema kinseyi TaxID=2817044 RepID=UPI00143D49FD|nr:ABC transporter G family member 23 isoform X2 [Belonocnema kinseyi]
MSNQIKKSLRTQPRATEDSIIQKMVAQEAIVVINARKNYGKKDPVLNGLNMTVSRGCIYGLLGASGCGKTTLLSCVVGVKKLDSGKIWVLGGKPGTEASGVPGPRVGYMPQEISLVQEFTVIDALYYFGRINGLRDNEIEERYITLSSLFNLPPKNRLIKHMSGGQQRRVSFAAALIHSPELLILDEPTVGLDPILRENIWNYLVKICQTEGTAIVITTHYIEEAKNANKIGLMRCGQLLAESTPNQLLAKFQCLSLEEAFLALSQKQKENQDRGITEPQTAYLAELEEISPSITSTDLSYSKDSICKNKTQLMNDNKVIFEKRKESWKHSSYRRFKALMIKNILQFIRHPGGILFALIFPIVQVMIFFFAIGTDPKGLNIAVVNEEAGNCNYGINKGNVLYEPINKTCDFIDLSCRFLHGFNDSLASKVFFSTLEEANQEVSRGKVVAVMHFSTNFSAAFENRRDNGRDIEEYDITASEIQMQLDMGDRQIGLFLQKKLYERYFEVSRDVISQCDINTKFVDTPLRFEKPVFGTLDETYTSFVAPTFILTVVFFLATAVSSAIIIADRQEGVWARSLVQGVKTAEILLAHLLAQFTVVIIQVTMCLCICFLCFNLVCKGSMFTVICLVLLTGLCGMCYGFLISVYCESHTVANFISTGSFYPVILLCGCVWPLEGMPQVLHWFSLTLPTTVPGLSLRGILAKGYPVNNPVVYDGFLVVSGWTAIFIVLCLIGLRIKESS